MVYYSRCRRNVYGIYETRCYINGCVCWDNCRSYSNEYGVFFLSAAHYMVLFFFHVHNLASMSDEDFYAQEDNPLFDWRDYKFLSNVDRAKGQKIAAWVLIVIGAIMLWNLAVDIVWDFLRILNFPWRLWNQITYCVPQLVVSLLMIYFGVYLIRGKKKELDLQMEKEEAKGDENHDA